MFQLNQTYTTAEFVAELGISLDTWKRKKSRERYVEYLEIFIEYNITTKGRANLYTITKIYQPYIRPNFKKKNTVKFDIQKHFDAIWVKNGPETCSRVAAKLISNNLVDSNSADFVNRKVIEVRDEKYGKPGSSGGPEGKCYYIRAKMYRNQDKPLYYDEDKKPVWDKSKYTYELLSSEDREQLTTIHSKWYPNDIEKMDTLREGLEKQEIKSIQEISDLILEKDLTKDERSQKFLDYTAELAAAMHCDWIVRATMVKETIVPWAESVEQSDCMTANPEFFK